MDIENEIEAKEIAALWNMGTENIPSQDSCIAFDAAIRAIQWKERQMIERIKMFVNKQTTGEYYNRQGVFQIDKYIDDMLNFIKGE